MKPITPDLTRRMREAYDSDRNAQTLSAACAKTDLAELAFVPMSAARLNGEFSIEIKTHGITAQEQSGRCWMFASMNILREIVIEKCKLEKFELSGNYLAFWDKLEKANNFLESIIAYADEPLNSQRMVDLLDHGIGDGGWWDEFVDLVQKYGVVPKTAMPEVMHSGHTANLLKIWNKLLRKDAAELRHLIAEGKDPSVRKDEMMVEFYKAECIAFGQPPVTFDFCYRDTDDVYHADCHLTPQAFYEKYIGKDLEEYQYIACQPSEKKPYHTLYKIHDHSNMADQDLTFLNLPIEEVKDLVLKQLKDGYLVWFGCDSRQYGERSLGYWDPLSFDYEGLLGNVDLSMSREDGLAYRECYAAHDMVLVGVNLDENGKPNRWKIENSWSDKWGQKGFFVASDEYFNEFVYEAVIRKQYLNEQQLALLSSEPIRIEPWEV